MLKVTLDIFSGLPNPTWTLEGEAAQTVLKEIQNTRGAITDIDADIQPLGYRGFIIEPQGTFRGGLPQAFRVKNSNSLNESKAQEILKQWRRGGSRAIPGNSGEKLPESETPPAQTIPEGEAEQSTAPSQSRSSQCPFVATQFDPRPWNQSSVIRRNNCYNYATPRQTNTFAQPGRASSFALEEPLSARQVIRGALLDGAHPTNECLSACDRRPYTQFLGYFYAPKSMKVR